MKLTIDELRQLSPRERLSLIEQLWDRLTVGDIPVPPAQQAELDRRLATLDAGRPQSVRWEALKTELGCRCP